MKRVTLDQHNEDRIAFARTINFTGLFEHIKTFANITCDFHQPEITTSRDGVHITFMSDDVSNQTGPFATILRLCYICSFSNYVVKDEESGELRYWVDVNISYEHKDGGSNGMNLLRTQYTDALGWIFRGAGDR